MRNYSRTEEYDIVIAGGGTAACVVAGRLAAANPTLSVLIIEAGKNNYEDPAVRNPAALRIHLEPASKTARFYKSKPSEYLLGREAIVPSASILGGGSSINFMIYTRAQGIDFDAWKSEGWAQEDMLPLLNKLETYHPTGKGIDKSRHGHSGPIHITKGFRAQAAEDEWMRVATAMGELEIEDLQDLKSCGGWSRWARYVCKEGYRQDAAHCYLHPLLQDGLHPNLHLMLQTQVKRILFDGEKRAIGVEVTPNPDFEDTSSPTGALTSTVKAKKMVVLSCGGLHSPLVLERSGIGHAPLLNKLGIPVISELPGVGENLQDHHLMLYPYKTSLTPEETMDGILSGRVSLSEAIDKTNPMRSWNAGDISSKLRPSQQEVDEIGGEFKELYDRDFKNGPERPLIICSVANGFFGDHSLVPQGQYMSVTTFTAYPYSRGSIHIKGQEPSDEPDFDTGFLSHPVDVAKQMWAYKKTREIMRRVGYYRGELEIGHPKFLPTSTAATVELKDSVDDHGKSRMDLVNLQYGKEDDAAIERHIRENVTTMWHSLGTCAMRPRENAGVVDKDLNVYGVTNLKVADLSIAPENVGANTANTALAIGEKAAIIIAKELGLVV